MAGSNRQLTAKQKKEKREVNKLAQQILSKTDVPPTTVIATLQHVIKVEVERQKTAEKEAKDRAITNIPGQILNDKRNRPQENETQLLTQIENFLNALKIDAANYLEHNMLEDKYKAHLSKNNEYEKAKVAAYEGLNLFLLAFKDDELNCINVTALKISYFIQYINQIQKNLNAAIQKAGGSHKGGKIGEALKSDKINSIKTKLNNFHLFLQGREAVKQKNRFKSNLKHKSKIYNTCIVPGSKTAAAPQQRHVRFADQSDHKHGVPLGKNSK